MTDMPERIWAEENGARTAYIRADLVAAKDAEIARLRALLRGRDGYNHDVGCSDSADLSDLPCYCGHDAVAAYFREIEG